MVAPFDILPFLWHVRSSNSESKSAGLAHIRNKSLARRVLEKHGEEEEAAKCQRVWFDKETPIETYNFALPSSSSHIYDHDRFHPYHGAVSDEMDAIQRHRIFLVHRLQVWPNATYRRVHSVLRHLQRIIEWIHKLHRPAKQKEFVHKGEPVHRYVYIR